MCNRRSRLLWALWLLPLWPVALWARADDAADQQQVGAGHYARGRWQLAVDELEAFLKAYPQHSKAGESLFLLGEALVQLKQLPQARTRFRECLVREPTGKFARQALFRAAEAAYLIGALADAKSDLEQYLAKYPDDALGAYVWPYLGDVAWKQGDMALAARAYQRGLAQFPEGKLQDDCRVGLARALERQGRLDEAERYFLAVAGKQDSRLAPLAQYQWGLLQFNAGRHAEAERTLAEVAQRWPQSEQGPESRLVRGWACYKLKRYADAGRLFSALIDNRDWGVEAGYWLGLTQLAEKQPAAAAQTLLAAANRAGKHRLHATVRAHAGDALLQAGDARAAIAQFDLALAGDHAADQASLDFALLGKLDALLQVREFAAVPPAAAEFRRRFPQSNLLRDVERLNARALIEQKQFAAARTAIDALLKRETRAAERLEAQYLLSLALEGVQQYAEAERQLRPVLAAAQGKLATDAWLTHGSLLVAQRQFAAAIEPLQKHLQASPTGENAFRARAELAICLARTGKLDQAKQRYGELTSANVPAGALRAAIEQLSEAALDAGDTDWSTQLFARLSEEKAEQTQLQGLTGMAWSQFRAGQMKEAAGTFARVLERRPPPLVAAEAALARGQALEALGQNEPALAMYDQVIAGREPSDFGLKAFLAAARLRAKLRRYGEAADGFARLMQTYPKAPQCEAALYEWAWALADAGRHDESLRRFQQLRRDYPRSRFWADATWRLAERAFAAGQYDRTTELLTELLARRPEPTLCEHALLLQGQTAVAQLRWPAVRESFERLSKEFPQSSAGATARYWIAEAFFREKNLPEAQRRLNALAAQPAGKGETWRAMIPLRQAQILAEKKKWAEALRLASGIEKQFPAFELQYEADYLIGRCLADEADFEGARRAYRRALNSATGAKTETAATAQWFLGESYFHQKNYAAALREFLRLEILYAFPQWQSLALLEAAKCHELLGEWRAAVEVYQRLLHEYPKSNAATDAAGRLIKALPRAAERS